MDTPNEMKRIFIVGHISPDLDATAAPVVYAEFLKHTNLYKGYDLIPVRVGEVNNETISVFNEAKLEVSKDIAEFSITGEDSFILVDHNEESQRFLNIDNNKILEIVDHHKININFTNPVKVTVIPVGSTCTVVYELCRLHNVKLDESFLLLILNSILSDTLGLKSSTTTGLDSNIVHEIIESLKIDLNTSIYNLFKAKSDITKLSVEEIALKDFKIFDFAGKKVLINQIETVEPHKIIAIKDKLISVILKIKEQQELDQMFVIITDIMNVNSQVICADATEIEVAEKAFITKIENSIGDIGPRMSRKKDIAPPIELAIKG